MRQYILFFKNKGEVKLKDFIESKWTQIIIAVVVVFNALCIGALSLQSVKSDAKLTKIFVLLDTFCLYFFAVEMVVKLIALRFAYFKSGWNLFDMTIVLCSFSSFFGGNVLVLRLFRVLRIMRLFSVIPQLQFILSVIARSVPSVTCLGVVIFIVYYIYACLGTQLFGEANPEYFGDLGRSFYTLFQVMTGDSWSEAVARPTIAIFPYAWAYFVSFIIITTFIVLNMVIGVIIDSINEIKAQRAK